MPRHVLSLEAKVWPQEYLMFHVLHILTAVGRCDGGDAVGINVVLVVVFEPMCSSNISVTGLNRDGLVAVVTCCH